MAAPALVALAHGSRDPRSAATINALVAEVRSMRPDLKIERAFLDLSKPSLDTAIDRLSRKHDEIVGESVTTLTGNVAATASRVPMVSTKW